MDALLESTKIASGSFPSWDFATKGDVVPIITGAQADAQGAAVTAYTQRGTIPQLPDVGIPWAESLTGDVSFGEVDNKIRNDIVANGHDDYEVTYKLVNDKLTANVEKKKAVTR